MCPVWILFHGQLPPPPPTHTHTHSFTHLEHQRSFKTLGSDFEYWTNPGNSVQTVQRLGRYETVSLFFKWLRNSSSWTQKNLRHHTWGPNMSNDHTCYVYFSKVNLIFLFHTYLIFRVVSSRAVFQSKFCIIFCIPNGYLILDLITPKILNEEF